MVVMLVDKLMTACCGDNDTVNALMSKLPWKKNKVDDDGKDDVAEEKIKIVKKPTGKFTDKDMKYELTLWKDMPLKVRRAVEDLGGDETKWNNSEWLDVDDKHWDDLTEEELKAVETLGWEKESWDHKWEHTSWADLPEVVKKAATEAGFTGEIWDDDEWTENLHKRWDDLAEKDKQAMAVLGWHKHTWD